MLPGLLQASFTHEMHVNFGNVIANLIQQVNIKTQNHSNWQFSPRLAFRSPKICPNKRDRMHRGFLIASEDGSSSKKPNDMKLKIASSFLQTGHKLKQMKDFCSESDPSEIVMSYNFF